MKELKNEKRIEKTAYRRHILFVVFSICCLLSVFFSFQVHGAINNTINFQTRITNKTTGLTPVTGTPACVSAGADTCDFRIRIWNIVSGGTATAGNNLLYEELFTNQEIGDYSGRLDVKINSVCAASQNSTHSWGTTVTSATLCQLFDDNGDVDSTTGVSFDRTDLFLELTFDPSGAWTTLASPPGGIETFTRTSLMSVPSVFSAQSIAGVVGTGFVQLSPTTTQNTSSSTPAINVRQQGTGNTIQLQENGVDRVVFTNSDQLQLTGGSGTYVQTRVVTSASNADDYGLGVDTDSFGTYYSGFFQSPTSDFDGTGGTDNKSPVDFQDIFISKYNVDGTYGWTRTVGASGQAMEATSVAGDNSGNVYATGDFTGTGVDFDGTGGTDSKSSVGGNDVFLTKYTSAGVYVWTRTFGGTTNDFGTRVAVDSTGVYVTGTFTGASVDFDGTAGSDLKSSNGGSDNFLTKYNTDGTYAWTRTFGGTSNDTATSVATDALNGFVYFAGGWSGTSVDFDGTGGTDSKTSVGAFDTYYSKYTTSGAYSSSISFGGAASVSQAKGIAIDELGNIYLSGTYYGTVDFDAGAGTASKTSISVGSNSFFAKYLVAGTYSWVNTIGRPDSSANNTDNGDIKYSSGSIYSVGKFIGSPGIDFDGTVAGTDIFGNNIALGDNLYITSYRADGNYNWTRQILGTAGLNSMFGVAARDGYVWATGYYGYFDGPVDFDSSASVDAFTSAASSPDIFLTKYTQAGGILIGGDATLYRDTANTLKTDGGFTAQSLTIDGLSNFKGNLSSIVGNGNGSTTTTGSGTASSTMIVGSTTNFESGSLILINSTTYRKVVSVLSSTSLQLDANATWSGSQTVVEKSLANIGGTGSVIENQISKINLNNGLRVGLDSNGTTYGHSGITSNVGLLINGQTDIANTGTTNINTLKGLTINNNYGTSSTGTWSTGTQGGRIRIQHTAVVYNGKMYIVHGAINGGTASNSIDSFDFATNTWKSLTAGGTAAIGRFSVVYNGKIYVWGGSTGTFINTMDIYDIATDSWTTGASGGTVRANGSAVVYNGKMYNWAGQTTGGTLLNTMDIYDIASNSWSTGTAGGTARWLFQSAIYNGKMYNWAGTAGSPLNSLDIYDINLNTWSTGASGGTARYENSAVIFEGKLYGYGGTPSSGSLNTIDLYDISTNTWSAGVTGGTGRNRQSAAVYNGRMYVFGGFLSFQNLNTMDIYTFNINNNVLSVNAGNEQILKLDTNNVLTISGKPLGLNYVSNDATQFVARAWSTGATIGTARTSAMSAVYNNKIYVWGGATNTGSTVYTNTLEIYNITTNTWSTGTAGGTARRNGKSIVYRGKIYFFFGCTNAACTTYATAVDVYDILTDSWSTATSGGTGRGGFTASLYNGKVYIWAGCAGACANVNTLDIYDIPSNSWTTGVAGGTARRNADSGLYNGKIYNYGGLTGVVVNTIDIYDIATSTWSTGLAGGTARSLPNVNIYNGKLYSTHGFTTVGVNTTDVYDIDKNVWSTGLAGGTAGYTGTSVIVGANIYVISGLNSASSAMLSTVDILNLGYKSEDIFNISSTSSSTNGTSAPDDGKLFRFDAVGRAYTSAQGGWFSVGADYAEYMHTEDTSIEAGDIVSLDLTDGKSIVKAKSGDSTIIGAISTEPGFVGNIISLEDINSNNPNWKLMSMVGQVPVKVKGNISVGDAITGSDIEGVGRKANYGEANIGIAQDNHSSESIDTIGVLITRNNSGISNNIQIDFGKQSEGGFRLSDSGKMQFKDKSGDWKNIADSSTITDALLWEQRGDNALLSSDSNLVIGLDQSNASDTKLQVLKDLESRSGLSFLKITASGSIQFNNENVGFRVNESTNGIEFRDATTGEWKSLSGLLISRIRFNKDIQSDQVNQVQINGWDYLESDGINSQLLKTINFPVEYKYQPFVSLGIIGESNTKPEKPSDCSDISNVKKINASEVSNKSFKVNITAPVEVGKYYCYTWLAN